MSDKKEQIVGVIGAGRFGLTLCTLLAENNDVLLYARNPQAIETINNSHRWKGIELPENVMATNEFSVLTSRCDLIFPVIPSSNFRAMLQELCIHLTPRHILIHGTKGLDVVDADLNDPEVNIKLANIKTMSEVILDETNVLRVGCISGPNLSIEILDGQPTATVIASEYYEVIKIGEQALSSSRFFVFGSNDIKGPEFAGSFKNIIAIGAGILFGMGMGKNVYSVLVTRGLREMIQFGELMDISTKAFLGSAGIGDLIATSSSANSRNFKFGQEIAKGRKPSEILESMDEVAEGVRMLKICYQLSKNYKIQAPITQMLYRVVFEDFDMAKALTGLMRYPFAKDVDFL